MMCVLKKKLKRNVNNFTDILILTKHIIIKTNFEICNEEVVG